MINLEELAQSEAAAEFRAGKTTAVPEHSLNQETHKNFDLGQVEQDLFNFFNKISGSIPEWIPVVPSFLKAKREQWAAGAALRGKDLATDKKIEQTSEALKLFLEKTFSGLWQEGKTALDIILIVGTGGSGNVAVGAERIAAQKLAGSVGKISLESLTAQLGKIASGGEGAVLEALPSFFKGLAWKLSKHPEQAGHLLELGNVFERLLQIPGAKPLMKELLSQQEWWQNLKPELESLQKRTEHAQRMMWAVNKTGFTMSQQPA